MKIINDQAAVIEEKAAVIEEKDTIIDDQAAVINRIKYEGKDLTDMEVSRRIAFKSEALHATEIILRALKAPGILEMQNPPNDLRTNSIRRGARMFGTGCAWDGLFTLEVDTTKAVLQRYKICNSLIQNERSLRQGLSMEFPHAGLIKRISRGDVSQHQFLPFFEAMKEPMPQSIAALLKKKKAAEGRVRVTQEMARAAYAACMFIQSSAALPEEQYRSQFWHRILDLLVAESALEFDMKPEFRMATLSPTYKADQRVDIVMVPTNSPWGQCPILMVECAPERKERHEHHKDLTKMAFEMKVCI